MTSSRRIRPSLSVPATVLAALATVALALPAAAAALPAPTLLMATGGTGDSKVTAPASPLYSLDPATGATLATTGSTGYAITGLAQDPTTGILYGVSNKKSPIAPLTLLTINPTTGAATQVGPLGPGENRIADIAFNSAGQLYGWDESGVQADVLASIDKATGTVTQIGENELSTWGSGLSFDPSDTLWFFGLGEEGPFFTVDTATGKATERGKLVPLDDKKKPISAAAWDCAGSTLNGILGSEGEGPYNLLTINTASGLLTNKGTTVFGADGLEWYCPLAFEFAKPKVTISGGKTLSLGVLRGPRIRGAASVSFATKAGSAKAGQDFVAASGPLTFGNRGSEAAVSVRIKKNPKAGQSRSFKVVLSGPSADGTVGTPITVTIKPPPPGKPKIKGPASTTDSTPTFKLSSKVLPARFRCKLDKGKFKGCGKNGKKGKKFTTPPLSPGAHKLTVQVVNGAGKKSKPLKKSFTVLLP